MTGRILAASILIAIPAQADHVKVFLLGGQSNMVGYGVSTSGLPTSPVNLQEPQDDVLFYYGSALTTLRPGSGSAFGPEVTFGRTVADAVPSDTFCLIKSAASGTSLASSWDPTTGATYTAFRNKVSDGLAALSAAGHTHEIVGMLWTQGERDAKDNVTTAQYEFDLNEFIADIRTRYGANLPFFLSRLSSGQTNLTNAQLTEIRAAQENVAASDPKAWMIDTDAMALQGDNLHFTAAGQIALGEAFGASYLSAVVPDATPPGIAGLSPSNRATGVDPAANLVVIFDESVAFGTGYITIRESVGDAVVERFDVGSPPAGLTLSGVTVTINPTSDLATSTGYYLEVAATAIDDLSGNSFVGFAGNATWGFTTGSPDLTNPVIMTLSPIAGAGNVSWTSNLVATFDEDVVFGTGSITLRESVGDAVVESFDVGSPSANLALNGATLTIDPTSDLAASTGYYVEIAASAIDDSAGNSFAGISDKATWSFSTLTPSEVIDGSGITATASSEYNNNCLVVNTVNQSGLTVITGEYSITNAISWFAAKLDSPASENWIQWDLGDVYTLSTIHVWNVNQTTQGGWVNNGIGTVDIYVSGSSTDPGDPEGAGAANWTLWAENATFSVGAWSGHLYRLRSGDRSGSGASRIGDSLGALRGRCDHRHSHAEL